LVLELGTSRIDSRLPSPLHNRFFPVFSPLTNFLLLQVFGAVFATALLLPQQLWNVL